MSIKRLVNDNELWKAFVERIDSKIEIATKTMVGSNDYEHILRYQGAIRELQKLKYLKDEINGPTGD